MFEFRSGLTCAHESNTQKAIGMGEILQIWLKAEHFSSSVGGYAIFYIL